MENNKFNPNDIYIGKVIEANISTRELEVFIPKLMPTLAYGFSDTLRNNITKTNKIKCNAWDRNQPLPEKDSLVAVLFLDNDIKKIYWINFNPFGSNTYFIDGQTSSEKVLSYIGDSFNIMNNNMIPNKDMSLGNINNPFKELHGYLDYEYIKNMPDIEKMLEELKKELSNIETTEIDEDKYATKEYVHDLIISVLSEDY